MAYDNINYKPVERISGEKLPLTGWNRPNKDIKMIRKWYSNFPDWQSVLPKTDYSLDKNSKWYTHEWVPGVPVRPNLSRPPIRSSIQRRFTSLSSEGYGDTSRQRFTSSAEEEALLLFGNGSMTSIETNNYHKVWYRRIISTIWTVVTTITTFIFSKSSVTDGAHSHTNGIQAHELSYLDDDIYDTRPIKKENVFMKILRLIFQTIAHLSYLIVLPFFKLYRLLKIVEGYLLCSFKRIFRLTTTRRRRVALVLLILVPYLIMLGLDYEWNRPAEHVDEVIKTVTVDDSVNKNNADSVKNQFHDSDSTFTNSVNTAVKDNDAQILVDHNMQDKFRSVQLELSALSFRLGKQEEMMAQQRLSEYSVKESSLEVQPEKLLLKLDALSDRLKKLENEIVEQRRDGDVIKQSSLEEKLGMIQLELKSLWDKFGKLEKTAEQRSSEYKIKPPHEERFAKMQLELDNLVVRLQNQEKGNVEELKLETLQSELNALNVRIKAQEDELVIQNLTRVQSQEASLASIQLEWDDKFKKQKETLAELNSKYEVLQKKYDNLLHQNYEVVHTNCECSNPIDTMLYADKIGIPDYALQSSGGGVVSIRCSKSVNVNSHYVWLGVTVPWSTQSNPLNALQPSIYPGECWCFEGSEGYLVVSLSANVTITLITLEHAHKSVLPPGAFAAAPKKFTVIGLETPEDANGVNLGTFVFEDNDKHLQQFETEKSSRSRSYPAVELHVLSNHGASYTCIYRFRVHGTPEMEN